MNKLFTLTAVAAIISFSAISADAQVSVGLDYGLANTMMTTKTEKQTSLLHGLNVYIDYNWKFLSKDWGVLSVSPGVKYSFFGDSYYDNTWAGLLPSGYDEVLEQEHYIGIPVHFRYAYELPSRDVELFAYAGPEFAFGVYSGLLMREPDVFRAEVDLFSGEYTVRDIKNKNTTTGGLGETGYGRFDMRFTIGLGVNMIDDVVIKAGYDFGLINRYVGEKAKYAKRRMDVFHLGIAYEF